MYVLAYVLEACFDPHEVTNLEIKNAIVSRGVVPGKCQNARMCKDIFEHFRTVHAETYFPDTSEIIEKEWHQRWWSNRWSRPSESAHS